MVLTDVLVIILICIVAFQGLFIIGILGALQKFEGMFTVILNMVCSDEQDSGND